MVSDVPVTGRPPPSDDGLADGGADSIGDALAESDGAVESLGCALGDSLGESLGGALGLLDADGDGLVVASTASSAWVRPASPVPAFAVTDATTVRDSAALTTNRNGAFRYEVLLQVIVLAAGSVRQPAPSAGLSMSAGTVAVIVIDGVGTDGWAATAVSTTESPW